MGSTTVAESSSVLERFLGCSPFLIYVFANISPGTRMESCPLLVTKTAVIQETIVDTIRPPVLLTDFMSLFSTISREPVTARVPAKP